MAPRPDLTVVIRTQGLLLRADLRRGSDPRVQRWREPTYQADEAIAQALRKGGKPGKRVWFLDSAVWLGEVALPGSAVAGLADKDLVAPAAYEAEAISDLSPAEAITAVQRRRMAQQDDQFLVAQARRAEVVAVAKAVRGAGAKLAGISHPAGLPEALSVAYDDAGTFVGSDDPSWRRVEFWSDSVVLTESISGRLTVVPLGIAPGSDWRRALEPYLRRGEPTALDHTLVEPGVQIRGGPDWQEVVAASGTARWLAAGGGDPGDSGNAVPVGDLADDDTADAFAAAWARVLATTDSTGDDPLPTLRAPKAPAARWPAVVVGVLALALAGYTVFQQRRDGEARLEVLQGQLQHAEADQRKIADRRKQARQEAQDVRTKEKAVKDLEAQLERAVRERASGPTGQADRRPALAEMLSVLTGSTSEQIVIQSIEHTGVQHEITGIAVEPAAASRLARELSARLADDWSVSPAQIEPEAGPQRVVWRFSTKIEPAGAAGSVR
ncbi:MAG: hypothetical protein AAF726_03695 [Planctomycetota bacterium]